MKSIDPKVSVVLASYNGEKFIEEQLESLIKQTVPPDEIVISDDGSTDGTLAVVRRVSQSTSIRFCIIKNTGRKGYAGNFENGIMASSGDVIFFCDQDDVWLPKKIQEMLMFRNQNLKKFVFMNDCRIANEIGEPSEYTKIQQLRYLGLSKSKLTMGCCMLVERQFLLSILPIPMSYDAHDDWICDIADIFDLRVILDTPLQIYRIHGKNTSSNIANTTLKRNLVHRCVSSYLRLASVESRLARLRKFVIQKEALLIFLKSREVDSKTYDHLDTEINYLKIRLENLNSAHRRLNVFLGLLMGQYRCFRWSEIFLDLL